MLINFAVLSSGHDIEGEVGVEGRVVSKERKGNIFSVPALLSHRALHCMTSFDNL